MLLVYDVSRGSQPQRRAPPEVIAASTVHVATLLRDCDSRGHDYEIRKDRWSARRNFRSDARDEDQSSECEV